MASFLSIALTAIFFAILAAPPKVSAFIAQESCQAVSDLLFVVDVSASISNAGLKNELSFLQDVISKMKIGPNSIQVGLILFGHSVFKLVNFNSHQDLPSLQDRIGNFHKDVDEMDRSATNTPEALRRALKCVATSSCGTRSKVNKLVIVLTDGQSSTGRQALIGPAGQLKHARDTKVMAIGIGGDVDGSELDLIASDHRLVFTTPSFDDALDIVDKISTKVCEEQHGKMPAPTQICRPHLELDLLIVQDLSASIGKRGWVDEMQFNRYLIEIFTQNNPGVKVALEWFHTRVGMSFCFNQYQNHPRQLLHYFNTLYCGAYCAVGGTYTGLALAYARKAISPSSPCGARPNVRKLVVFVTDGNPSRPNWEVYARYLKAEATVASVGVGNQLNTRVLHYIASDPRLVFTVKDFKRLPYLVTSLTKTVCQQVFH